MKDGQINYIDFRGNEGREINNIYLGVIFALTNIKDLWKKLNKEYRKGFNMIRVIHTIFKLLQKFSSNYRLSASTIKIPIEKELRACKSQY